MKSKKSLLSLGLLALVLVLGVGYAVVSSVDLTIGGNVATLTTDSEIAVSFNGTVTPTTGKFIDSANTNAVDGSKSASIGVKDLSRKGDTVTITYTIKNAEQDIKANLLKPTITGANDYFTVTTEYKGGQETEELAAGQTTTLAVTVTLAKTPTTSQSAAITVTLEAEPVAQ